MLDRVAGAARVSWRTERAAAVGSHAEPARGRPHTAFKRVGKPASAPRLALVARSHGHDAAAALLACLGQRDLPYRIWRRTGGHVSHERHAALVGAVLG